MLIIHAFSKSFNGLPVFSDISLSAEQGSFTVLLGPSGCGKSTLFDLLMGVLPPDGGRISLNGRERPDLRGAAAYMAQKDLLLPWKTLRENALLPVTVRRRPTEEDLRRVEDLFSLLGLSGREDFFSPARYPEGWPSGAPWHERYCSTPRWPFWTSLFPPSTP